MKKPVVDYREFRFSRLGEPRFSHVKLLAGWIVYFVLYFLTENLIPFERCHVIHSALDDAIPFNEYFAVFYCYWYVFLALSLLYFFLYDIPSFKQLQFFIIVTQLVAMLVYIVYPSVQYLRPETMPRDNFFSRLMALIYSFDTPSGVCPSLHVAYSIGIACAWCRYRRAAWGWKAGAVVSAVLISLSTMFVKQHSAVDVFAALPLGALAWVLTYVPLGKGRLYNYLHEGATL